jgi:rhodanese-related sulfurtransferase
MWAAIFVTSLRDALRFAVLAVVALSAGLVENKFHADALPLIYTSKADRIERSVAEISAAVQKNVPEVYSATSPMQTQATAILSEIDLPEFQRRLALPGAVVVDARPEIFHRFGHIPGALPLPRDEFEVYYPKHQARLEAYKDKEILVYCQGSSCEDSHLVASALTKLGYTRLAVFTGGWNAWTQQGLPQEK